MWSFRPANAECRSSSSSRAGLRSWMNPPKSQRQSSCTVRASSRGMSRCLPTAPLSCLPMPVETLGPTASARRDLRRVIQEIPDLSDKLLEAFQTRRTMLEQSGFVGVRLFGHVGDPDVTVIREFFDKNKVPHTWIDSDAPDGRTALQSLQVGPDQLPFVACNRGTRSPRPTVTRLAECLGLKRQISTEPFDLVIIGAGPAGLAAAVYGASEGLTTIVLDRFGPGGQAGSSSRIENYMGFPAGMTGADLANRGYLQALKFGAELVAPVEVRSMTCEGKMHSLVLDDGQIVRGRTVLIATGATYQRLPVAGCERWDGVCIYYSCTTVHARACQSGRARRGGGRQLGRPGGHVPGRPYSGRRLVASRR